MFFLAVFYPEKPVFLPKKRLFHTRRSEQCSGFPEGILQHICHKSAFETENTIAILKYI